MSIPVNRLYGCERCGRPLEESEGLLCHRCDIEQRGDAKPAAVEMEPARPALETLRSDAAFLRHYLGSNVVSVPVEDYQGRIVNRFEAVRIPVWAVRQRLDDIDAAIADGGKE